MLTSAGFRGACRQASIFQARAMSFDRLVLNVQPLQPASYETCDGPQAHAAFNSALLQPVPLKDCAHRHHLH